MASGDILIVAAVSGELEGLTQHLSGTTSELVGGREILRGRISRQVVRLLVSGPGVANTVQSLTAAVEKRRPGLILQTGCGGGFSEAGIQIGDVAIASSEIDVHLGLEPAGSDAVPGTVPFPVIQTSEQAIYNRYPVTAIEAEKAARCLKAGLADSDGNVFTGPFVTVSTITATVTRSNQLHRHFGAVIENMEGAGAAHVAIHYDLPFLEIRAVSNRVGDRDKRRWDLPLSFRACAQAVRTFLENRP